MKSKRIHDKTKVVYLANLRCRPKPPILPSQAKLEVILGSADETLRLLDRESGDVVEEAIYGRAALEFGYRTAVGKLIMNAVPQGAVSRLFGFMNRLPSSKSKIPGFVRSLGIDAGEAELPLSEYRSLDHFFSRRLKPEARPVDPTPHRFVSPADGRTLVFPGYGDREFSVKGSKVRLVDLLGHPDESDRYRDGTVVVVRLAPCDYHRFHFPDSGTASSTRLIKGRLHSVHPYALESGVASFKNKRTLTCLESDHFGLVTIIEVGAFAVGSIVQTYASGSVHKGQEKGYFRFGGSTVVVLLPKDSIVLDEDLVAASERGIETFVKMGTSIGSASAGSE